MRFWQAAVIQTALFVLIYGHFGNLKLKCSCIQIISYTREYLEKKNKGYKAQKLFSELSTDLCTSLKQITHSQVFSGRKQNRTAALFTAIQTPSVV